MTTLNFKLLSWQKKVFADTTRFKVVAAGRRCGKSRLAAVTLLINALECPEGSAVMYVAPTLGQARSIIWDLLNDLGRPIIKSAHINNLEITLTNGRKILVRGADNPDSLRGVSLTYLVMDEVAFIKLDVWEKILRASLSDKKGKALFISTPSGRNWFYDIFSLGQEETDEEWKSWHFTTKDNETIDPKEVDAAKRTLSTFSFKQGAWAAISGAGGFEQPIDSLFFNTSIPSNNVDTAKMRWDSELGTVVLGMYDQVPNELGFKNFWLVKNQTGSTITKGSIVYANGTVGASGRITVAKFIANGSIDPKYLLGVTAHNLTNGEDGYVISYGKIRQVNTDTFAAGTILYPSPTTAGVWTDVEPVAPDIDMPIGFCVNSSSNNGTIAIKVSSGLYLREIHDVSITSPVDKASLYYKSSEGLWRDTTAALLVSDTASMLSNYATKAYADTTDRFYARQEFRSVSSSTLTWTQSDTLVVNDTTSLQV